jgi:pimeloyl-ACP methyl ester carboxylesterase
MTRLFLPGFGARATFYEDALGPGWSILDAKPFDTIGAHVESLVAALDGLDGPVTLGGHSMGGALAVLAAVRAPDRVERLVLVSPAGLPLAKPVHASLATFAGQLVRGRYRRRGAGRALVAALLSPRAAWRLAQEVRGLDLRAELGVLQKRGIDCDVVGCVGDTLTPVGHCRRIAELAGGRYRELRALGGHMSMLVEPRAFHAVVAD